MRCEISLVEKCPDCKAIAVRYFAIEIPSIGLLAYKALCDEHANGFFRVWSTSRWREIVYGEYAAGQVMEE